MTTYDAIVMGTPVYWYHVTAQFKILVDRLYCFLEFGENPETGEPTLKSEFQSGKKFLFILSTSKNHLSFFTYNGSSLQTYTMFVGF